MELSLEKRIKGYESTFTSKKIDASLPFVMRLDGHAFSRFTRGLKKPYDYNLHQVFTNTTMFLMKEFNADTAYTHSDEISLLFYPQKTRNDGAWKEPLYGGRIQKIISICAGMCTMFFNKELVKIFTPISDQYVGKESTYNRMVNSQAYFDCRIFQLPNDVEMFSYMYFRSQVDCRRNHISELSRKHYSKTEINGKSNKERIAMLNEKGIVWDNEPACFRRGSFFKRVKRLIVSPNTINTINTINTVNELNEDKDSDNLSQNEEIDTTQKLLEPQNTNNNSSNLVRFDIKEIDVDLIKFDEDINNVLKCNVYENIVNNTNNQTEQ